MAASEISGSLLVLFLYDVSDEIRLDDLRKRLGDVPVDRKAPFRHHAPEYVQFEQPPVTEPLRYSVFEQDPSIRGRVSYYSYGVVSLKLEIPFRGHWNEAIELSARWMNDPHLEQRAAEIVRQHLEPVTGVLVNPYRERLTEDYFIFHLCEIASDTGRTWTAARLLEECGDFIAQIVRGERATFSAAERGEILGSRMSYYDTDLLVAGWTAALIYDTLEGAAPTIQLLEYANTQLLEFRHYDAVLTRLLAGVYRSLEKGAGLLGHWRMARKAGRFNTIRLEVRELTETVDNSIKFLSDMFAARLYRMAASKIGVPDYRGLVEQKLESAGELYSFMMDQFHQGRAFLLELMVVIILVIELVHLFRGGF